MEYNLVVCGGTFDHLHKGHISFLRFILAKSKYIALGLTSDVYIKQHKNDANIQSYSERKRWLEDFFHEEEATGRIVIAPINSVLYPSQWETYPFEAIIATESTKEGAAMINKDRTAKKLSFLPVVIAPMAATSTGEVISSSAIRKGIINTAGEPYINKRWLSETLFLPEKERMLFQKPFGNVLRGIPDNLLVPSSQIVTVGDIVTKDSNRRNIGQRLSIVDYRVERKNTYTQITELGFTGNEYVISAENPPGHLTPSLFHAVIQAIANTTLRRTVITVSGEEDLAVLPVILAAPLGFVIFYGQPHEGVVQIDISQTIKQQARKFLEKFTYVTRGY